jgi:hypothetical protein
MSPFYLGRRLILRGDRRGIQALRSDRDRILVSRDTTALQRPRRVNWCVRHRSESVDERHDTPVPIDLIETLRKLASVIEQIAHSLAVLQKLYAEELVKRDAERKENAAERQEWKQKQKQSEEKFELQMKEPEQIKLPRLPWQMQLFWGTLFLLLILCVLVLAWHLFAMVRGRGA